MQRIRLLICIGLVAMLVSCNGGQEAEAPAAAIDLPPAGVLTGEPLAWRTLASFPPEASLEKPRPGIVVGEFTKDSSEDVLLVDWMGDTEIIQASGKHTKVDSDIWPVIIEFTAWDYDRDGCCELVPDNYGLIWVPEAQGTVKVGSG